jgi:hypothetical protein
VVGFWVLGFGFWVLGFGFWVLGFGFWVLVWVLGSVLGSQKQLKAEGGYNKRQYKFILFCPVFVLQSFVTHYLYMDG